MAETISISEAARRSGVSASTLKRWAEQGVVEVERGRWTAAAAAQARLVARMRERGHPLAEIRNGVRDGRLATGALEDLLPGPARIHTRAEAAATVGLEEELVERIMGLLGTPMAMTDRISDEDVAALEMLESFATASLVASCSSSRVYAQAIRKVAEAEVRLFHLFVHEPMIREAMPPSTWPRTCSGWPASCCRPSAPSSSTSISGTCASTWSRTWSATWRRICR